MLNATRTLIGEAKVVRNLQHCFGVATAATYCNKDSRCQSKSDFQLQHFWGVATITCLLQQELVF
jgi:hypothetical protein